MKMRTRIQENKFGQALGYAWGRKDQARTYGVEDRQTLLCDDAAFATFYSMLEDLAGHHRPLQDAYKYFSALKLEEQKAYRTEWARRPWSMYEELHKEKPTHA